MHNLLKWLYKAVDIIFPKFCVVCKKEGKFLCDDCFRKIKINNCPVFIFKEAPVFNKFFIPCSYHKNDILKKGLHLMKYKFYKDLCGDLAPLIVDIFGKFPLPEGTILVPVPLHKKRLKYRGFNQSEEISKYIGGKLNLKVINLLIRERETISQATLNREQRLKNVNEAFKINPQISYDKNTPVLLIDDVCTTMSTIKSTAEVLQKNGFKTIMGSAIARAELDKNL